MLKINGDNTMFVNCQGIEGQATRDHADGVTPEVLAHQIEVNSSDESRGELSFVPDRGTHVDYSAKERMNDEGHMTSGGGDEIQRDFPGP